MSLFYEHPYLYFDKVIDISSYELVLFFVIFWIIAHFSKTLSRLIFKDFSGLIKRNIFFHFQSSE